MCGCLVMALLEMGNRLGQLVVSGRKTATCSSLDIYKMEEEQLLKLVNTT